MVCVWQSNLANEKDRRLLCDAFREMQYVGGSRIALEGHEDKHYLGMISGVHVSGLNAILELYIKFLYVAKRFLKGCQSICPLEHIHGFLQ